MLQQSIGCKAATYNSKQYSWITHVAGLFIQWYSYFSYYHWLFKMCIKLPCLKPETNGTISRFSIRGELTGCKKSNCMEVYEKMAPLLTWFLTSVNSLLMSSWSKSFISSLQHDVHFVNYGLIRGKISDDSRDAIGWSYLVIGQSLLLVCPQVLSQSPSGNLQIHSPIQIWSFDDSCNAKLLASKW